LANLGYRVAPNTVRNILKKHGIEPAPERSKRISWKTFLKAHWDTLAATDFFTVEVWTAHGLTTYYVLFFIHLSTRHVSIGGITTAPNGMFMKQVARNMTDVEDGFLLAKQFLIMDRDNKYTEGFMGHLDREGIKPVRCPVRAPNCNAFAERFVRSIKQECLNRMIFFGEASLRRAVREYMAHYQAERNHQGIGIVCWSRWHQAVKPVGPFAAANGSAECSIITTARRRERPVSVFAPHGLAEGSILVRSRMFRYVG
jgi:transposase InsO family protein